MSSFHDGNNIATLIVMQDDGETIVNLQADPSTHALDTSDGTTGSDNGPTESRHDNNNVHVLMAISSEDGVTPICLYADENNNLLIQST